jgi:glycyl-tRNA synthetase beta chain
MSRQAEDFLLELGTEELPPTALGRLSAAFCRGVEEGLSEAGFDHGAVERFATPRRLAVRIRSLAARQPDQTIDKLGPAVAAAFDDAGQPKPAAQGFARSCGVSVDQLERRETDKGERLAYSGTQPGESLEALLPGIVESALKKLPIPKRMRWGSGEALFVRPVQWLVCLHGKRVLPLHCLGHEAGRDTRGHRFHHGDWIRLDAPADYEAHLEAPGFVIADFERRRGQIRERVNQLLDAGETPLITEALLDEVTALVEWPVPLSGSFDERFLVLPREVIIAVLEGHQRYFPVADSQGRLLPKFVTVANIDSLDPARVVAGNERVIRPRLADALFFWEQDAALGLSGMTEGLARVSYQNKLGSMADKTERVRELSEKIADMIGEDAAVCGEAAGLCKADLLSAMVGEFPELQGLMGGYYAQRENRPEAVAAAVAEHYDPVAAGAAIPASRAGCVVALADKLDTLAGIFALGKRPSGDKDPFALRRAALGVLRILVETPIEADLDALLRPAIAQQPLSVDQDSVRDALLAFFGERLKAWYGERDVSPEAFAAVMANGLGSPADFDRRLAALQRFSQTASAVALCGAHKRIRNILRNKPEDQTLDPDALSLSEEKALHDQLERSSRAVEQHVRDGDYGAALESLAAFETPVAAFFDNVMVMSENPREQSNRLALLGELDRLCRRVADISRLSVD